MAPRPSPRRGYPQPDALVNGNGNAGRIGYLYNHYGVINYAQPETDSQKTLVQALQLAIWKLEYDSGAN